MNLNLRGSTAVLDPDNKVDEQPGITKSSGNVFADLGFAEPQAELLRAELAARIGQVITERGWTQKEAAAVMRVDQARVSQLLRHQLKGFAIDRLVTYLDRLGQEVEIKVSPREDRARRSSYQKSRRARLKLLANAPGSATRTSQCRIVGQTPLPGTRDQMRSRELTLSGRE